MQMAAEAESLLLSFLLVLLLFLEENLSNQEVLWHKDTNNLLIAYI